LDFEQKQKPTNGQVVTHGDGGRRADHWPAIDNCTAWQ
jgi:hypothetical protein